MKDWRSWNSEIWKDKYLKVCIERETTKGRNMLNAIYRLIYHRLNEDFYRWRNLNFSMLITNIRIIGQGHLNI